MPLHPLMITKRIVPQPHPGTDGLYCPGLNLSISLGWLRSRCLLEAIILSQAQLEERSMCAITSE